MSNKSTIVVFAIAVYIIAFNADYKHRALQAKKLDNDRPVRPKKPTFRDLPIGRLNKHQPIGGVGVTRVGYMKLVNQVQRFNLSTAKLKRKIVSQNKTIFYQNKFLQRQEREIKRQKDKIRTYKAQIRSYQLKLIDKDLVSDISLVSDEKKGSKKPQNVTKQESDISEDPGST